MPLKKLRLATTYVATGNALNCSVMNDNSMLECMLELLGIDSARIACPGLNLVNDFD